MALKSKTTIVAGAVAGALALFAGPSQAVFDLTGIGYVQYGDAQSYSLPIASIQDGCTGPGCEFYVASSPGQISSLTVLGTGSSGQPVVNNFTGMDNAYATPSGVSGSTFWRPDASTYQGTQGTVGFNNINTWDSTLLSLKTFLAGQQMIVFFNNNQVNNTGTAAQSLAAWGQIYLTDATGAIVPGSIFDFTNSGTFGVQHPYDLVSQGGGGVFLGDVSTYTHVGGLSDPVAGTQQATDYVLSGGSICVETGPGVGAIPVPVPCGSNPIFPGDTVSAPINHNLGANQAAYAILFPEMQTLLNALFAGLTDAQLAQYTFHADVRLGCDPSLSDTALVCTGQNNPLLYGRNLNNGFEQLFISTATNVVNFPAPEPGTLALIGLAMLGVFGMRRKSA